MTSNTPHPVIAHLARIVDECAPHRLLLVGTSSQTRSAIEASAPDDCTVVACAYEDLQTTLADERFDIAIVVHTLERCAPADGKRLLARLRDRLSGCVVVGIATGSETATQWRIADFIAMGFRRSPGSGDLDSNWAVYRYDIHDYKITPNWLSARYWANPERWDEERW